MGGSDAIRDESRKEGAKLVVCKPFNVVRLEREVAQTYFQMRKIA